MLEADIAAQDPLQGPGGKVRRGLHHLLTTVLSDISPKADCKVGVGRAGKKGNKLGSESRLGFLLFEDTGLIFYI